MCVSDKMVVEASGNRNGNQLTRTSMPPQRYYHSAIEHPEKINEYTCKLLFFTKMKPITYRRTLDRPLHRELATH